MAQVAELSQTNAGEEPQKQRSKLPKVDAKTLTPAKFFEYTASLTVDDWQHAVVYFFRQRPRIIRQPKYIDKVAQAITEEYILQHHGSGKYLLWLVDTDIDKTICQSYPEFDDPAHPPLIDLRELDIGHEQNRTFVDHLKRIGKLTMDGDVVQPKSETDAGAAGITQIALEAMRMNREQKPGIENKAFDKMMEMMSNASAKSIEIALANAKKEDPSGFMTLMVQMMQAQSASMMGLVTKLLENGSSKGPDPMLAVMMKQLELSEKRAELAEKRAEEDRKEAAAEKQRAHEKEMKALELRGDPMDMIDKVLNIKERLGGDEPDTRNWKEKLVDQGMQYVPQIMDLAGRAFGGGYKAQQPQQQRQQAPPPAPPQTPQQPAQPQATGATPVPEQPPLDPDIQMLLKIFEAQGRQVVAAFANDPNSGPDLARTVTLFAGAATYERIARMGKEKILTAIKMLPDMWADLMKAGNAEMVSDFIDDFIEGPEPEEPEPPKVPPPPPANKKAKKAAA